jgi:hypothetical protein
MDSHGIDQRDFLVDAVRKPLWCYLGYAAPGAA